MDPVLSRRNHLTNRGKMEGKLTDYGWIVYEAPFLAWCKSFNQSRPGGTRALGFFMVNKVSTSAVRM